MEWVHLVLEALHAMSTSSDDYAYFTKESDGACDSEHDSDVDMCMEENINALYSVDLNCDVNMERNCDNEEEGEEEEEDE